MRIIAVDDEIISLELLKIFISECDPEAELRAFEDPKEALEFADGNPIDVAFLDILMRDMTGTELGEQFRTIYPKINIIFTTSYSEYAVEAFHLKASDYILKPVSKDVIKAALDNLRYPVGGSDSARKILRAQCFGNFDLFYGNEPVEFCYKKTKEMLAYLIDRNGASVTIGEMMAILWEDEDHRAYYNRVRKDLVDTLSNIGYEDLIIKSRGMTSINRNKLSCDYFDYLDGKSSGINAFHNEYMSQYSWAEDTLASL